MLFNKFLENLLSSKVKIKMLRVMSHLPEKTWTARELAKFIGVSNMSVLRSLGDFQGMNLIDVSRKGSSSVLKIKTNSFTFKNIIKPLFDAEKSAFSELIKDLKDMVPPKHVSMYALFGSVAEHLERENSDIDLLIVTENKDLVENLVTDRGFILSQKYGNEISPFIMTPGEFKAKREAPFIKTAKLNHLILSGGWHHG